MNYITTINPIWSVCNKKVADALEKDLFFKKEVWIKKGKRKEKKIEIISMIEKMDDDTYFFYTGLVNKAFKILKKYKIPYEYSSDVELVEYDNPRIKGKVFRPFQKKAIMKGLKLGRGYVKAATGVGKTTVITGWISAFSQENILILCHSIDILGQMEEEFTKLFGDDVTYYKSGKKLSRITLTTDKTFIKIVKENEDFFDVVIIDEGHHVAKFVCQYAKILREMMAPVRLSVTATPPVTEEGKMCLNALIGPQIFDYDIAEGQKDGYLAKADLKIIKCLPLSPQILLEASNVPRKKIKGKLNKPPTRYQVVYFNGIVDSESRNMLIAMEALKQVKKGKSVLINIVLLHQGNLLQDIFSDMGTSVQFVHGKVSTKDRNKIKKRFEAKKEMIVIASTVWKEGVDIKSIDCCINGSGHKSEIAVMQKIGRGLRVTDKKERVLIIDFDDSPIHKYLAIHFSERKKLFKELGWWDNRIEE